MEVESSNSGSRNASKEEEFDVYRYNREDQQSLLRRRPWHTDPWYFRRVRIAAAALVKMVAHARSGGQIEIMGLMQGKLHGNTIYILDSFALPVEGTETRVNAQSAAYEYIVNFNEASKSVGRSENIVGWYHSHPGYGCWLSGIDVDTQRLHQLWEDPFVAVVIDPIKTVTTGKVDIGAFRTLPDNVKVKSSNQSSRHGIPLEKSEDFGAHADLYYSLDVSCFRSPRDEEIIQKFWGNYWIATLLSNQAIENQEYEVKRMQDLNAKLKLCHKTVENISSGLDAPYTKHDQSDATQREAMYDAASINSSEKTDLLSFQLMRRVFGKLP